MQKTVLLPVFAAAVLAGCSTAPKYAPSECKHGIPATDGYVATDSGDIMLSGAGDLVHTGYWKPENAHPCETRVMLGNAEDMGAGADSGAEGSAADGRVRLDSRVLFDFDSAMLTDAGKVELDLLVADIGAMVVVDQILVIGHTDSVGSKSYNQMLSERRAASVRDYLAERLAELEIKAEGRGEEEPIADNATAEGRAKNRRVEVIVDGSMEASARDASAPAIQQAVAPAVDKMADLIRKLTN